MEHNVWKTISGFDGYEVSNNGDVRSKKRLITIHRKSCTYTRTQPATILTPYADKDGYLTVTLYDNKTHKGVHFRVSRLVALSFIPNHKRKCVYQFLSFNYRGRETNKNKQVAYKSVLLKSPSILFSRRI